MPKITKATTHRGDDGFTDLAGGGRVAKNSARIRAVGAVDELNCCLGWVRSLSPQPETADLLAEIQHDLFRLGADLSAVKPVAEEEGPRIERRHVRALESRIEDLQQRLKPLANFVLPGGCPSAAGLHLARAVCRRAECDVVALPQSADADEQARLYLNRLSDLLFLLACRENESSGTAEEPWNSRR
jgi:cob(I)alamin adenosyltransferase